ncbi:response regulator transcription factor, partial [Acidipropionibacterium jensenii]
LTRAETQVLRLLARGCTVAQVSAETFTSVNTVKTHVRSIYRKLGVNKRTEALWRADELGLLGSD